LRDTTDFTPQLPMNESQFDMISGKRFEGFRLTRLEVKNFGNYHRRTQVFDIKNQGLVFAGENGVGKSTAIDALLLLTQARPNFNSAGSDKKSDRNIESYYLGQIAKVDGADGVRTAKTLRQAGDPETFMGILAVYSNADGEVFTIARLLYISASREKQWRHIWGPVDLSLDRDFPQFPKESRLNAQARENGFEASRERGPFVAGITEQFGFDTSAQTEAAFRLAQKAVGAEPLESVTRFARETIMPEVDFRSTVDGAIKEIDANGEVVREVRKIRDRVARLKAISTSFDELEQVYETEGQDARRQDLLPQIAARVKLMRLRKRRLGFCARVSKAIAQKSEVEVLIKTKQASLASVEKAISKIDGDRIESLRTEIDDLTQAISMRLDHVSDLAESLDQIGITLDATAEATWNQAGEKISGLRADTERKIETMTQTQEADKQAKWEAHKKVVEITAQLASMDKNRSTLPQRLQDVRSAVAENLGIANDDLPFLCELVQIRRGEEAWEGVANRVLGGVGAKMLVAPDLVSQAKRFVNSRHWGTNVRIESAIPRELRNTGPRALARKLAIKSDHAFADVAEAIVAQNAFHDCVSAEEFSSRSGPAVTVEGSVQAGNNSFSKNDTYHISDRSKYILGWSIEDRRVSVLAAKEAAEEAERKASEIVDQSTSGIRAMQSRLDKINMIFGLKGWKSYDDVRVDTLQSSLKSLKAEYDALATDEVTGLFDQKDALDIELATHRKELEAAAEEVTRQRSNLQHTDNDIAEARKTIRANVVTQGNITRGDLRYFRGIVAEGEGLPASEERRAFFHVAWNEAKPLDGIWEKARVTFRRRVDKQAKAVRVAEGESKALVQKYLMEYPYEGNRDLTRDVAGNDEVSRGDRAQWVQRLQDLLNDDLPRLEQRFEEQSKDGATTALTQIRVVLNSYDDDVKKVIDRVNRITTRVVYDPTANTNSRLRIKPSSSEVIRQFNKLLDEAIRDLQHRDLDELWDLAMKVIEWIREDDTIQNRDRRSEVLDLRNWYEVEVEEFRVDDEGVEHQLRVMTGKDGNSGGQKERLTMLLLGAGIAQAFGCHDRSRAPRALHLITLDEAFMRSSEETASACTYLLTAMGLQVMAATPLAKLNAFRENAHQVYTISKIDERAMAAPFTYAEVMAQFEAEEAKTQAA
jgi:uncharacterized protein YPO0396